MRISLDVDAIETVLSSTNADGEALSQAIAGGLDCLSRTRDWCHKDAYAVAGEISRIWGGRKNASAEVDAYLLQMTSNVKLALEDFERNEDDSLAETRKLYSVLEKGASRP